MFGLDSQGQEKFISAVTCMTLAVISVALRIYCKIRHKQGVRVDDYCMLGGLAFFLTAAILPLWGMVNGGGGKEFDEMLVLVAKNPKHMVPLLGTYLKSLYLAFIFVTAASYCIKMSILLFYRRIFFVTTGYKRATVFAMVIITVFFITTEISVLLVCQPVERFWNRMTPRYPGKCFNFNLFNLAIGIVDTVIDVGILMLPIRMAFSLRLAMRTRVAVAGIFALGSFVIITNIVRIKESYASDDTHMHQGLSYLWSTIHHAVAILCACLPIYKPLWTSGSETVGKFITHYAGSLFPSRSSEKSTMPSFVRKIPEHDSQKSLRASEESHETSDSHQPRDTTLEVLDLSSLNKGVDHWEDVRIPIGSVGFSRRADIV